MRMDKGLGFRCYMVLLVFKPGCVQLIGCSGCQVYVRA